MSSNNFIIPEEVLLETLKLLAVRPYQEVFRIVPQLQSLQKIISPEVPENVPTSESEPE